MARARGDNDVGYEDQDNPWVTGDLLRLLNPLGEDRRPTGRAVSSYGAGDRFDEGMLPETMLRAGDKVSLADLQKMYGSRASPNPHSTLKEYLEQNNLGFQDFVTRADAIPYDIANGVGTYNPSKGKGSAGWSYSPKDTGLERWMPTIIGMVAGAGIGGLLPGTTSAFAGAGGAAAGSAQAAHAGITAEAAGMGLYPAAAGTVGAASSSLGALNSFDTGAMGEILGTGASDSLAGGLNALNSFDTGEMAKVLGTDLSTAEKIAAAVKQGLTTPGVSTAQTLSNFIKQSTGLDVSPGVVSTLGKLGLTALAAKGASGNDGGLGATAGQQGAVANDALGLAREQWAWNKARADELWPQTKALVQQQLDIGATNAERSKSEWDTYQKLYLPAEERYAEQTMNWDTPGRRTQREQEAVADIGKGYDAARGTMERGLSRVGVRPGGAGYVQAQSDLSRARAADTAGAMNNSRRQVEAEGMAGLERLTNIGRGRPSTSFSADQLALSAGNSANANTNQNTAVTNAGLSSAQGWYNTGVNALNSQGQLQNQANRNQADSSLGVGKLLGQLFFDGFADGGLVRRSGYAGGGVVRGKATGYAMGGLVRRAQRKLAKLGYASGGMVYGPGTETSDSIPAVIDGQQPTSLSTGEAVLNTEAVQLVGEDFVERINQAGLQRRGGGGGGQIIEGQVRRIG